MRKIIKKGSSIVCVAHREWDDERHDQRGEATWSSAPARRGLGCHGRVGDPTRTSDAQHEKQQKVPTWDIIRPPERNGSPSLPFLPPKVPWLSRSFLTGLNGSPCMAPLSEDLSSKRVSPPTSQLALLKRTPALLPPFPRHYF